MELLIVFIGIIGIILVYAAWHRIKDYEEDDVVYTVLGTYVHKFTYEWQIISALIICLCIVLVGLLW